MKKYLLSLGLLLAAVSGFACTSVIISGSRTESGQPMMFKNRDTDCLDNRLGWFANDSIRWIGLMNAPVDSGEVWAGTNSRGFSIMNTATYNFQEDSLTATIKMQMFDLQKDSDRLEMEIARMNYDSLALKKEKDRILVDTLRPRYAFQLDSLRMELASKKAIIDSMYSVLAVWHDSIARHPEIVPSYQQDREGEVMNLALATCSSVEDFLRLLDSLPKPLGVEANFGVIDQFGGAMYIEANNWRYVTYDVNQDPLGYRVQTNFAFAGNVEGYKGYERYLTAKAIMHDINEHYSHQPMNIGHQWMFNHLSRSYRHEVLSLAESYCPPSGIAVDQDFIPRRSTSAAVCFEGPAMWTVLGYPAAGVALPALVCDQNRLPAEVQRTDSDSTCVMSNLAMQIKREYIFTDPISNGKYYFRQSVIQKGIIERGRRVAPSLMQCSMQAEDAINAQYNRIYQRWRAGRMTDVQFYTQYQRIVAGFPAIYQRNFKKYLTPAAK